MRSSLLQSKLYGNSVWKVTPKTSQTAATTLKISVQAWSYCHAHKSSGKIKVRPCSWTQTWSELHSPNFTCLPSWELKYPTYERGKSSSQVPLKGIWYLSSLESISPFPNQPYLLGIRMCPPICQATIRVARCCFVWVLQFGAVSKCQLS